MDLFKNIQEEEQIKHEYLHQKKQIHVLTLKQISTNFSLFCFFSSQLQQKNKTSFWC